LSPAPFFLTITIAGTAITASRDVLVAGFAGDH
jgi:hypothetical protein